MLTSNMERKYFYSLFFHEPKNAQQCIKRFLMNHATEQLQSDTVSFIKNDKPIQTSWFEFAQPFIREGILSRLDNGQSKGSLLECVVIAQTLFCPIVVHILDDFDSESSQFINCFPDACYNDTNVVHLFYDGEWFYVPK